MKKLITILVILFFSTHANAQKLTKKAIPLAVQKSFASLYLKATNIKWEKENGSYEAEFKLNGTEQSVLFDIKGNMLESEAEFDINKLPVSAIDYIKKNYHNDKINGASKITTLNNIVTYEVELKVKDLIFKSDGTFIKESK